MDLKEIKTIIPHREPFILIDRVIDLAEDRVVAEKKISGREYFFPGHFPEQPIMPGVLIIEAMAQAGAVCVLKRPQFSGKIALFAGLDKVRFKRQVVPGDTLRLEVSLNRLKGRVGFASGRAYVDDQLAATADLIFAVQGD